ncbi:unnamed protein product [Cyprideis torosa]|uniref:U4/U6 small nuclear ribonucleoprotein Prp31 n=1 Tax=Cyprideis torosa TaxID=163714 RepID=A0A7R8W3D9_9CRUS|nr:unnamed protein product [Cyprideis torosa]CAG0879549.1 unnamed protein product [Cyprideis torosa]
MSLADELLADLEDDEEKEDDFDAEVKPNIKSILPMITDEDVPMIDVKPDVELLKVDNVHEVAKLRDSEHYEAVIEAVDECLAQGPKTGSVTGPLEADPEYQLMVEANNVSADIDSEILKIHKFVRDKYSKRFPELESMVVTPLEYMMTAKELGNELEQAKSNEALPHFLTQATIMVVSVTASTSTGQMLSEVELEAIRQATVMAIDLMDAKKRLLEYIESRMHYIAPNLSEILDITTAAKLMGVAGGLTNLSKMPSCNIMLLGAEKKQLSGFSEINRLPHTGLIYYAPIVQLLPPDLRRKAAKLVAAKATLAIRVDASHESPDGTIGRQLREEIEKKFDKWQEPPPVKSVKPLPAPIDAPKKRRGGKRVRKMKERYGMTELRKQANRMEFGSIEDDAYQQDLGLNLGVIKKGGKAGGMLRAAQVDEKTRVRMSKALEKKVAKANAVSGGSTTIRKHISGTASSVAFTPLQGLEIVNPEAAAKKVKEANEKYFSGSAGFLQVKKEAGKPPS